MAFNYSPKPVIDSSLVLYLDAANPRSYVSGSSVWTDVSRGRNTGALTNTPGYNSANGGSIVFDGIDDFVNISSNASSSVFALQNFTVDVWFKPTTITGDRNLWDIGYTSNAAPYYCQHMRVQNNFIFIGGNVNGAYDNGINTNGFNDQSVSYFLSNNTIYNVTWVREYNTNKHNIYINGQFICSKTLSAGNITYYNTPVRFGNSFVYNSPFSGNYYNLKYYNRVLSASEIRQNYNALKGRYGLK